MTDEAKLTLVQINDVHGYLEPHHELVWSASEPTFPKLGGFARISTALSQIKSAGGEMLVLDNGDMFHGTYPAVTSKGVDLVDAVNALGIDAMTAHWEFAWGPAHFEHLCQRLHYPMLALNCYRTDDGTRPFKPSAVFDKGQLRIGVIGLAATIIDKSMPPSFSTGRRFDINEEAIAAEITRLRGHEHCDLVVLLSHLGLPQDAQLAARLEGVDVILSGHTHNRLQRAIEIGGTLIIQSGCHGSFLGRLDLLIKGGRISSFEHQLIAVDESFQENAAMAEIVDTIMHPHREYLNRCIGQTNSALHRNLQLFSTMDDLLLAAISTSAGTDIAFSNGWRYGAPIPPGPITINDLWNIIPTNPPVSVTEMSGSEIRHMMEDNLERTFAADPYNQMGGYLKRFRGLTIFGKIENPAGHRIEKIFLGECELEDDEDVAVAFVTEQGVPAKYGHDRRHLDVTAIEALEDYISEGRAQSQTVGRFYVA